MTLLEVAGVSKVFPGVRALDDVSFALRPGEVHALVGENGAGKSTLIKVLTGVYRPDAGELRYQGEPVSFATPMDAQRAGISTIYQEVNLIPLMSVAQNLFLGREPRTTLGLVDRARMDREARDILAGYGVTTDVRARLGSLPLGAQQMVALARAVMIDAKVVVMDEPTSSLEPREVETLFGVIQDLHERGIGIIYVSHRMDELYRICDTVTILRDGKLVHTGRLADLERVRLVALMLGREVSDVRREGFTVFSGDHAAADDTPILRVSGLSSRNRLHDISFGVRPGEVVGLGGLLGAGRSETIKAIAGAYPVDSGEIEVDGTPLRHPTTVKAVAAGIAVQPEDRKAEGIIPGLSIRENIALSILPRMSTFGLVSDAKIDEIVDRFMKRLRIKASSPHQRVGDLSGGNQQKVLLARLLATGPKVLLLDEPTRGIDVGAKAEVQALIDELAAEGLGVVLVSSDAEELVEGSGRVVVLRDGAVVGVLTGEDVTTESLLATIAEAGA
ncbi:ribose transport system ATP-binding protein [Actinoplanes campanulatus]|uniref:Ribose transport system ATP-binding protein n=1 Tax=Actinoplanes campanulatus TaxID=113559 RepID=A0A7W5FJP4_9ACTN|nr:sugar ABC transporter ATP-binding protein [Actinoplanes campanulatus]MBB3100842.1 ribose transport system ATP-binding protein [Actinoplanes campanulatus]GGN46344.1 sugar ABC transporter ATP-binding protein [Actinoplanes campanulatus]GID41246.1 sugar ABC transporter ATP-binding protein [Actinoplanes campanulatus]